MIQLSVITVTYNAASVIEKCLQSITTQKSEKLEYIVVDGLSKDQTPEIVRKFGDKVDQFVSEKDSGIYDAMNKGWQKARGEFVLFINADDVLNAGAAEKIIETISAHPEQDIHFFPVDLTSPEGRKLGQFRPALDRGDHHYYSVPACHQGIVMRLSTIERLGGFDLSFKTIADFDLVIRSLKGGAKFGVSEFPVATFSLGGASADPLRYENELRKLYLKHGYYDVKAKLFLRYVRLSIGLQKALPKSLVKFVKKIKKSKFSDFEV